MNSTSTCRICLNNTATISVFDNDNDIQYSAKIMRCVSVLISEEDILPKKICSSCVSELSISYEFVKKCEASDRALRYTQVNVVSDDLYADLDTKIGIIKGEGIKTEFDDNLDDNFLLEDSKDMLEEVKPKRRRGRYRKKMKRSKMGPIQCVICGLMAISRSAMEAHMRTHTGERPFSCQSCDLRFITKGALKRHTSTYHSQRERRFTCETCGNSFFSKSDIITHMRIHTNEKPYICPYCSKGFRQIASLIRHKRIHTGERPFSCPICDKKFSDKNLVKKHQLVHSDEKKYSCHLCSKSMKSKTALNTHLIVHSNEKKNICGFCGMAFSMKGNLRTHIRRLHSEKSGECTVCMKTFSDLEEHMRKHTGERPYLCQLCTQSFATKGALGHHFVFKHENAAKFKCSIGDCTKTFPTAMMLEFHLLKQHTNHTPYVCQHCSRGFFRTCDLNRHLKVSHMEVQIKLPMKVLDSCQRPT